MFQICDTRTILNRKPFLDLEESVNKPLADDVYCLDNDNERPRLRLSDDQTWQKIMKLTEVTNSCNFQKLDNTNKENRRRNENCVVLVRALPSEEEEDEIKL